MDAEVLTPQAERTVVAIGYALLGSALVLGFTYLAVPVLYYLKREQVRSRWVATHLLWQVRTFWFSLVWNLVGAATAAWGVGYFILVANLVWYIYRVIRGWWYLSEQRPLYL